VALVTLIGPDGSADFGVDLEGWAASAGPPPELPVTPEIARLRGLRVLCVYGAKEERSICPQLDQRHIEMLRLGATGHYYGAHVEEIVDSILAAADGVFVRENVPRQPRKRPNGGNRNAS
jgi:type IV secretory pathway VirJ component